MSVLDNALTWGSHLDYSLPKVQANNNWE